MSNETTIISNVLCGTGHRPDKLGGYELWDTTYPSLVALARSWLERHKEVSVVISGMAQGWDQALAEASLTLGILTHAYCPCHDQDRMWPATAKEKYRELVRSCSRIVYAVDGPYAGVWCMSKRNQMMVDDSQEVLALYDGSLGGTANCVRYASRKGKVVHNLWDEFISLHPLDKR